MGATRALWALWAALGYYNSQAGAFVLHLETDCFLSPSGRALWANWTMAFNQLPLVCYDNKGGHFLPCGLGEVNPWFPVASSISQWLDTNAPPQGPHARQACQNQTQPIWKRTAERRAPPQVLIHPVTRQGPPSARVLSCVAWGFFPPEVDIAWFWNGAPVEAQQGPLSLRSNGDWTFQAERSLALEPRPRGIYSCRVNHPSLQEPIVVEWAPGLPLDLRLKVGLAGAVLGLGLVFFIAAAAVFWRENGRQGYVPIEGSSFPEGH
nr:PREDICTED: class II histocompatibility antigen, M beta 1 chain [Anolis carolinensis]|eukprot:XP_008122576.1 PREDICTED: class II histocompatibility antigen, M beta 1 chain [Anolis carolinensis]